jgi:hypothetical protein
MPSLSPITSNFFINLINRLGVRPPPPQAFELSNVVQPVSIVDSDVVLTAQATTQILGTPFTAGELAAPVAGTILADTGALVIPANYAFFMMVSHMTAAGAGTDFTIQRRDAANAANIWSQLVTILQGGSDYFVQQIVATIAANERLRLVVKSNAVGTVQGSIWVLQL